MIQGVTRGKPLPDDVLEQIIVKTDGVPLFVEQLTKTILGSGLVREEGDQYVLARTLTPLAIPSTVQDSLMARLDRLAPVKEIAQIGAVIGREFSLKSPGSGRGHAGRDASRRLEATGGRRADQRARSGCRPKLRIQACADPGHGLRHPAAQPTAADPRRHRPRPRPSSSAIGPIPRRKSWRIIMRKPASPIRRYATGWPPPSWRSRGRQTSKARIMRRKACPCWCSFPPTSSVPSSSSPCRWRAATQLLPSKDTPRAKPSPLLDTIAGETSGDVRKARTLLVSHAGGTRH